MSEKADSGIAEAVIEKGNIVIRVPVRCLPVAYQGGIDAGYIEPGFRITNARAFAKDLVQALNSEEEDGTTPIHRLFDAAMEDAIEQGADGVEECDDDEFGSVGASPAPRAPAAPTRADAPEEPERWVKQGTLVTLDLPDGYRICVHQAWNAVGGVKTPTRWAWSVERWPVPFVPKSGPSPAVVVARGEEDTDPAAKVAARAAWKADLARPAPRAPAPASTCGGCGARPATGGPHHLNDCAGYVRPRAPGDMAP